MHQPQPTPQPTPSAAARSSQCARLALKELRRAVDLHLAGEYGQAEKRLRAVLREDSELPEAQHHLAVVLHARGQYAAAVRHLTLALALDPHLPGASERLARYRADEERA